MTRTILQLWRMLDPVEKRRAIWLGTLMLLAGLVEISGVMSVVPLIAALTSAMDPCERLGTAAGKVCSALLPSHNPRVLLIIAFALIAFSNLITFCVTWFSASLTWAVWRRLARRMLAAYLDKPYEFFFESHSADAVRNIIYETERFSASLFMPMLIFLSRMAIALGVGILMLAVDPLVSIAIIALLSCIYLSAYRQLRGRIRKGGELALRARANISRITTETIGGIRELKMYACGSHFSGNFGSAADMLARQYVYDTGMSVMPRYIIETSIIALMLGFALYLSFTEGSWMTAAPLLAFYVFAAYRLLPPFQQIFANAIIVQQNAPVADTLEKLVRAMPITKSRTESSGSPSRAIELTAPVRLEAVTYCYPGAANPVLDQASMVIPHNATVGLVGATGAGKSTVIDLVAGLIQPSAGTITINGVPLDPSIAERWRSRIGYVPQAIFLLDDTIRSNIAFGLADSDISQERVERAARLANIHEFIDSLPHGYATATGERGVRLSGGQRQRLAIARALYRDPAVLVFDEATSALDAETEQAVMEAIRFLSHQKTLLIISHRPTTLSWCDITYEVAGGKINRVEGVAGNAGG